MGFEGRSCAGDVFATFVGDVEETFSDELEV